MNIDRIKYFLYRISSKSLFALGFLCSAVVFGADVQGIYTIEELEQKVSDIHAKGTTNDVVSLLEDVVARSAMRNPSDLLGVEQELHRLWLEQGFAGPAVEDSIIQMLLRHPNEMSAANVIKLSLRLHSRDILERAITGYQVLPEVNDDLMARLRVGRLEYEVRHELSVDFLENVEAEAKIVAGRQAQLIGTSVALENLYAFIGTNKHNLSLEIFHRVGRGYGETAANSPNFLLNWAATEQHFGDARAALDILKQIREESLPSNGTVRNGRCRFYWIKGRSLSDMHDPVSALIAMKIAGKLAHEAGDKTMIEQTDLAQQNYFMEIEALYDRETAEGILNSKYHEDDVRTLMSAKKDASSRAAISQTRDICTTRPVQEVRQSPSSNEVVNEPRYRIKVGMLIAIISTCGAAFIFFRRRVRN